MAPARNLFPSCGRNSISPGLSYVTKRHNVRSPLSVLTISNSFNDRVKPSTARNYIDHKTRSGPTQNVRSLPRDDPHGHLAPQLRRLQHSPHECKPFKHECFSGPLGFKATGRDAFHMHHFTRTARCLMQSIENVDAELFNLSVSVSVIHA
jgi:hypothetical protein